MELSLVPSDESGQRSLVCSGRGFDPQITWSAGSQQRTPSTADISMGEDARAAVTSRLTVSDTEWKTGQVFTCQVSDRSLNKNVTKNIDFCSGKEDTIIIYESYNESVFQASICIYSKLSLK